MPTRNCVLRLGWGRLSSWTSGFPAAPREATPPSLLRALLQASRLEEWLSQVIRVAYVPKLNGMDGLCYLLGNRECPNSGLSSVLIETLRLERG